MTKFQKGDIVRIDTRTFANFASRIEGFDAQLTWAVNPEKIAFDPNSEKWHFRMLEGPMMDQDDYYCCEARFMTLQRRFLIRDKSLTKGLPSL